LARLTPARSLPLSELLDAELPRLPRSLVLMVVTPRLGGALAGVLQSRRSGIECALVWTGAEPEREAAALPAGIPIYPVAGDADLERLGGRAL